MKRRCVKAFTFAVAWEKKSQPKHGVASTFTHHPASARCVDKTCFGVCDLKHLASVQAKEKESQTTETMATLGKTKRFCLLRLQ